MVNNINNVNSRCRLVATHQAVLVLRLSYLLCFDFSNVISVRVSSFMSSFIHYVCCQKYIA